MALIPVILGWPPLFFPVHIAFLQLVIDPVCAMAFENEPPDANVMKRPPRNPHKSLINTHELMYSLLQGLGIGCIIFAAYDYVLQEMMVSEARAFTFVSLIISNLLLIFANRNQQMSIVRAIFLTNKILLSITLITIIALLATLYIPFF